MEARIVGLKGSGASTLMAALGGGQADGAVATVRLGDPRVRRLSDMFHPKKTTFAEFKVRVADRPAASGRRGEMERYLIGLAGAQVFLHVIRAFPNPMLSEDPDPARDLLELDQEFLMADLIAVERALERAAKAKLSQVGRRSLERAKASLDEEQPLRLVPLPPDEYAFLLPYSLLSLVPQVIVLNTASDAVPPHLSAEAAGRTVLSLPLNDAAEVASLSPEEQEEFARELGLPGLATDLVTRAAFEQMGLISFLTVGEDEVRAWPVRRGDTAQKAAGVIHSDIERGFIRAEVVGYETFISLGSNKACREAGALRLEGKDYVVQDGDIMNFRFNV